MRRTLRARALHLIPAGLKRRLRRQLRVADMEFMLTRLRGAGFNPRTAIDVGAYRGNWTRLCREIFVDVPVLMIEPQIERKADLECVSRDRPGCESVSAVLGKQSGQTRFLSEESNSRIVTDSTDQQYSAATMLALRTLDSVVAGTPFQRAELLKIDVQGAELEVLAGGKALLEQVEVVILEMSVIPIGPVPLAFDVISYMRDRGFRLYDLGGFNYRPLDSALWQIDGVFVREGSNLIASREWC